MLLPSTMITGETMNRTFDEWMRTTVEGRHALEILADWAEERSSAETQETISKWGRETFGPPVDRAVLVGRMFAEAVELMQLFLPLGEAYGLETAKLTALESLREPVPSALKKVPGEVADVLIVLYQVCTALGIDLQTSVDEKMKVNRSRKWKCDGRGVGQHVEK